MGKTTNIEIIIGTYEEFVVGYRFNAENKELVQTFASHSHNASVRCISHSEHYLASGGADDRIVIYDLKSRKEQCMLTHHNGTVNCLQFTHGHSHLISGGSDGMLAITRVGNWQLEKVFEKAHKGAPIIDIAIHPSNKLAISLGGDCTLRTWNLIKGRQAYVINLNSKSKDPRSLQFIKWAPDGNKFVLCGGSHTDIWNIETGGITQPIEHKNKVTYCLFYNDKKLIIGFENGCLSMLNLDNEECKEVQAHAARVKSIDICKKFLITCSSNGEVKIWNKYLEEVSMCNTGCRHTCINTVLPSWVKKEESANATEDSSIIEISAEDKLEKKRKKKLDEQDEDKNFVEVIETSEIVKKKRKKLKGVKQESVSLNEIVIKSNIENDTEVGKNNNIKRKRKKNNKM